MENISIVIAFFAGILSFLSPCVLPLVPGYISFLSGMSLEELKNKKQIGITKKTLLSSILFVIGFSFVFICLGASASFIGKILLKYLPVLTKIAGVIILLLGVHLLGILKFNFLNYEKHLNYNKNSFGFFKPIIVGIAFGFGWTPCIGPILSAILAIAATQDTMIKGIILLFFYSLGLGIPFIITGFSVGLFMRFFYKYKKFIRIGEFVAGLFLILIGGIMIFSNISILFKFVPEIFFNFSK